MLKELTEFVEFIIARTNTVKRLILFSLTITTLYVTLTLSLLSVALFLERARILDRLGDCIEHERLQQ